MVPALMVSAHQVLTNRSNIISRVNDCSVSWSKRFLEDLRYLLDLLLLRILSCRKVIEVGNYCNVQAG